MLKRKSPYFIEIHTEIFADEIMSGICFEIIKRGEVSGNRDGRKLVMSH